MIFNSNTTSLGTDHIAMAEGYDCSYGCALALVESARNDYKMFRAMLDIDARELQIQRESSGYVAESQIMSLNESAISGIWQKIKELFKKLAEKLKAIWHTFASKINGLYMSDKQLVKKYSKELYRKTHIGNLEVKWIKFKDFRNESSGSAYTAHSYSFDNSSTSASGHYDSLYGTSGSDANTDTVEGYKKESDDRYQYFCPDNVQYDTFNDDMDDKWTEGGTEPDTVELKDIGGIRAIISFMDGYKEKFKKLDKATKNLIKNADNFAKEADKRANDAAKNQRTVDSDSNKSDEDKTNASNATQRANRAHEMAVAYQDVQMKCVQWTLAADKKDYAQHKAAFMKAVAANDKKLEESTYIYLDAVAEAAEQEVEDVISSALSKEELSKINNASLNVMDSDVSDDPSKLTYGPDYYTDNQSYVRTSGSVDTDINSKSESTYFSGLFY